MRKYVCDKCGKEFTPRNLKNGKYLLGFCIINPYGADLCFSCIKKIVLEAKTQC